VSPSRMVISASFRRGTVEHARRRERRIDDECVRKK
jgi:hypothetical protein